MRRVMLLSSYVAQGTVGLQATLPALPREAFDCIALPTVILSNHPGHKACSGTALAPQTLSSMIDALDANGWLKGLHGLYTGYLPGPEHVALAAHTVQRLKNVNPSLMYIADPVLGDDPGGLYLSEDTAKAVRDHLMPIADLATPNRFELAWLTGLPVNNTETAIAAGRQLGPPQVAATSIPSGLSSLANVLVGAAHSAIETVDRQAKAPHGTGDYFAGALAAALLTGHAEPEALRAATLAVARVISASQGQDHLNFANAGTKHKGRS